MLSDTSLEADKVQIELLRKASVAQRISLVRTLTTRAIWLSKRAIARANPGMSMRELDLKYVELHYGPALAEQLRRFLADSNHDLRGRD
jgi:hypothetical protein